jgi:hypothetical protein
MPPKNVEPREWVEPIKPRTLTGARSMHFENRCGFSFGFTWLDVVFPIVGDLVRGPGFHWPAPYDGDA